MVLNAGPDGGDVRAVAIGNGAASGDAFGDAAVCAAILRVGDGCKDSFAGENTPSNPGIHKSNQENKTHRRNITRCKLKQRLYRLGRSSWCGRIRLAVCQLVRRCVLQSNHAGPVIDWPGGDRCDSRRSRPALSS